MGGLTYKDVWKLPNDLAADWLLHVNSRRRQYFQQQSEFAVLSVAVSDGQPSAHNPGKPTERKGLQLADIENAKQWIITIELVEGMLSPKKRLFLDIRRAAEAQKYDRDNGRPDWVPYVSVKLQEKTGIEISDRTMRSWWQGIVELTVRVAIKRGCL